MKLRPLTIALHIGCRVGCGILLMFLLCSCATGYKPLQKGVGFSEAQDQPGKYRVSFKGNGNTSLEQTYDFALLRSAEVTRQHGFSRFAVVDTSNDNWVRRYKSRESVYVGGSAVPFQQNVYVGASAVPVQPSIYAGSGSGAFVTMEEERLYCRPGATLVIQCFQEKPEKPFTYDAAELEQSLRKKYHLKR